MKSNPKDPLEILTRAAAASEPAVERALAQVLEGCASDVEVILQHQTGDGPCDLFLPGRRIVIEVKRRPAAKQAPVAGPNSPGSQEGETQFEQLQRYVLALRARERSTMWDRLEDPNTPWIGALTDGVRWWAWEWSATRDDDTHTPHRALHEQEFDRSPDALREAMIALAVRKAGKAWVPADPADLFDGPRRELDQIWDRAADSVAAVTQHRLWHDLVRGSGIEVAERRKVPLFLDHCLLVLVARNVTRVLDGAGYAPPSDGFISWIADAPGGKRWARDLFKLVDRYDWGSREADVLRNVYMAIVPKEDRKLYGEYYTPDWLASLIVEETLDDKWLEAAILEAYNEGTPPPEVGVLDPTCGSGTFLFHSARRILAAIPRVLRSADLHEQARIVSHLVHGIDIHPVAVEMARATLRRALPASAEPSVHQGDALLMSDTAMAGLTGRLFNPDESEFASPDGDHRFHVPHSFTDMADFTERLDRLVQAACDGVPLPASVTFGMGEDDTAWVYDAHESLTQIIAEHGNGVWAWYIRNQLMPRTIARRKVNRIVSNPPWLRWNEIQTSPRKENVRTLAQERDIWPSARAATGFDLGAVCVVETRQNFLAHPKRDPSAYVLNAAALRSENWRQFREQGQAKGRLDLSSSHPDGEVLRQRPFSGAEACVIGMRNRQPQRLVLRDHRDKIEPSADAAPHDVTRRVAALAELPWSSSSYAVRARNGATIFPAVLVRVDPRDPTRTLQPTKAKPPWSEYEPFALKDIPDHWRTEYIAPETLLAFGVADALATAIIPNEAGGLLDDDDAVEQSATWRDLSDTYRAGAGIGDNTPKRITDQLNYAGKLAAQWPPQRAVVYNASGQNLRAAVASAVIEHAAYRVAIDSAAEADYLVALLNAPCLAFAFRFARKSGRHFDKTPLEKVPIPLYRPGDADHERLAELSASIREARAADPEFNYPTDCEGELDEIDAIVARLLPDFCR